MPQGDEKNGSKEKMRKRGNDGKKNRGLVRKCGGKAGRKGVCVAYLIPFSKILDPPVII